MYRFVQVAIHNRVVTQVTHHEIVIGVAAARHISDSGCCWMEVLEKLEKIWLRKYGEIYDADII